MDVCPSLSNFRLIPSQPSHDIYHVACSSPISPAHSRCSSHICHPSSCPRIGSSSAREIRDSACPICPSLSPRSLRSRWFSYIRYSSSCALDWSACPNGYSLPRCSSWIRCLSSCCSDRSVFLALLLIFLLSALLPFRSEQSMQSRQRLSTCT